MTDFIVFIRDCLRDLINVLSSFNFNLWGLPVSLFDIIVGIILLSAVCAVLWRGVRT